MANLALAFDILARDRASKEFDHLSKSIGHAAKIGSFFGTIAGNVMTKALDGVAASLRTGFNELKDYQAGLGQANAVIKSTGGAAGVTAKHVEGLASSIQAYSGQTDDSIVAGENLLLTFTNIRNSVGKGNDIFDQATKTIADMSQALGQDTKTSAIQLGKALNDPVKGITALQRVGVSFTEGQKKQIVALAKSGHSMQAQKLILKELNKEFGGSAKAFGQTGPGQIARAKRSFEDFTQSIATKLLPVVIAALGFLNDKLLPGMAKVGGFLDRTLGPALHAAGEALKVFFDALQNKDVTNQGALGKVGAVAYKLYDTFTAVGKFVTGTLIPAFQSVAAWVRQHVLPVLVAIGTVIATKVVPTLGKIAEFIVGTVVPAIVQIVEKVAKDLQPAFESAATFIQERVLPALAGLWARFNAVLPTIEAVVKVVLKVAGVLLQLAAKILAVVIPIIFKLAGPILTLLFAALGKLIGIVAAVLRAVVSAFQGISSAIAAAWDKVIRPTLKFLADAWLGVVGALVNGAAKAFGWVPGIGPKLKAAAKEFNKFRDGVNASLSGIKNKTVTVDVKLKAPVTTGLRTVGDNAHAVGGYITGPGTGTSDSIPSWLSNGEFVVNAAATKRFRSLLEDINAGTFNARRLPMASVERHATSRTGSSLHIENLNVVSAPQERAETSVPRGLRSELWKQGWG